MKKLLILALTLTLLFSVACASAQKETEDTPDSTERTLVPEENAEVLTDDAPTDKDEPTVNDAPDEEYVIEFSDGRNVTLGQPADDALASLGEYFDMLEAPSCIHEGYDRVYTFAGFSVTTSLDGNGADRVTEVGIETAECVLANGLTTGSSVADMEAAYGTDYTESFGFCTYMIGRTQISLVTSDGLITSIVFSEGGGR